MSMLFTKPLQLSTLRTFGKVNNTANRCASIIILSRRFHESAFLQRASPTNDNVPIRLLLLGSPGAGKGTQSLRIQKNFNITAISSGDLLRQNIAKGTALGKMAATEMQRGAFISDNIMIDLINTELQNLGQPNWLLDGFPRTIKQAISLDEELMMTGQPLNLVINLHVPENIILKRIMDRWIHVPSGRVYNLSYNPPKRFGHDDITGEELTRRPDDNPETFKIRLEKHHALTEPLLQYYSKRGILITCAGHTSDEIYPQIEAELTRRFGRGNILRPNILQKKGENAVTTGLE